MLSQFTCGHTGRENNPPPSGAKHLTFIRVAEARGMPVVPVYAPCPDCKRTSGV